MRTNKVPIAFSVIFLAAHAIVPAFIPDIYPFSSFPMYSDAASTCIRRVQVFDEDNKPQNGIPLGLFSNYVVNPKPRIGCWLGPSEFDEKGIREEWQLNQELGERLCKLNHSAIRVIQTEVCKGEITPTRSTTEVWVSPQCY